MQPAEVRALQRAARKHIAGGHQLEKCQVTFILTKSLTRETIISAFIGKIEVPSSPSHLRFVESFDIDRDLLAQIVDHGQEPLWLWLSVVSYSFIRHLYVTLGKIPSHLFCQIGSTVREMRIADYPEVVERIKGDPESIYTVA